MSKAVRVELNRLLESSAFRTGKRSREFLEYVVEHMINGPVGALKRTLDWVELFQLPQDFDTGQRTIVRVTANEVRKKLAQHYHAENNSYHPVRIDLPPGSYSAEFKWETPPVETRVAETPVVETLAVEKKTSRGTGYPGARSGTLSSGSLKLAHAPDNFLHCCGTGAGACLYCMAVAGTHSTIRQPKSAPIISPSPTAASAVEDLRVIAGATAPYVDRSGRTWGADRFFSGGNVLVRPSERIFRTLDPDIYRHLRSGDFQYDIPLRHGNYELHLFFAETGLANFISAESSGEASVCFASPPTGARS